MKKMIIALVVLAVCAVANVNWNKTESGNAAMTVEFKPVNETLEDVKEFGGYVADISGEIVEIVRKVDGTDGGIFIPSASDNAGELTPADTAAPAAVAAEPAAVYAEPAAADAAEPAAAVTAEPAAVYIVREMWANDKTEIGVFADYASAEAACPPGFTVFTDAGVAVFTR